MDIAEAEKKLAVFIAETTRLVPDRQIFAGNMPEDLAEGICVSFTRGTPAGLEDPGRFTAQVSGRFRSLSRCRTLLELLTSALPVFGSGGFLAIRAAENDPVHLIRSGGEDAEYFEFKMELSASFI